MDGDRACGRGRRPVDVTLLIDQFAVIRRAPAHAVSQRPRSECYRLSMNYGTSSVEDDCATIHTPTLVSRPDDLYVAERMSLTSFVRSVARPPPPAAGYTNRLVDRAEAEHEPSARRVDDAEN